MIKKPSVFMDSRAILCSKALVDPRGKSEEAKIIIAALLSLLLPVFAMGQTAQLTERLGRTVLYEDVAISPDGTRLAWVQTTAAASFKATHVSGTSKGSQSQEIGLKTKGERSDRDPDWLPDSKTLAFFSAPGAREQAQLWTVSADGSNAQQRTQLKGYAARPRWSPDGKQIAFLYIEGQEGGGPLLAAPAMTGVIDTEIHNQRIAVFDVLNSGLRLISPAALHVYDFEWSPDGARFAATAAPGPGDNNWWIAQLYVIDIANYSAVSIYKPSFQIAIPRWSPDGKSVAFIEGLMSDEGFHGGDLYTIAVDGKDRIHRTQGHKGSVSSIFWRVPEKILLTETIGGGSAISQLTLANNSIRTLWQGGEDVHAFGNFPNFAISSDDKATVVVRDDFEHPPEIWTGPVGQWHQLTRNNEAQFAEWGKVESL
jgi:Tol biopolymer transport system component